MKNFSKIVYKYRCPLEVDSLMNIVLNQFIPKFKKDHPNKNYVMFYLQIQLKSGEYYSINKAIPIDLGGKLLKLKSVLRRNVVVMSQRYSELNSPNLCLIVYYQIISQKNFRNLSKEMKAYISPKMGIDKFHEYLNTLKTIKNS